MILEANLHWRYAQTPSNLVMPWYTLPCLKWLDEQYKGNWFVFEYGSGYSAAWWRANCYRLFSVESDGVWATAMSVHYETEKDKYIGHIKDCNDQIGVARQENFDCIIVDGLWREECIEYCRQFLRPGGFLIIDNYDSEDHDPSKTDGFVAGWEKLEFKQPNHSTWKTVVFKKP